MNTNTKIVKYEVTGPMGLHETGDIIEAIVLAEDEDSKSVLLYHPRSVSQHTCSCLEIANKCTGKMGTFYIKSNGRHNGFINVTSGNQVKEFQAALNEISYKDIVLDKDNKIKFIGNNQK